MRVRTTLELGAAIRDRRQQRGLTQAQLADAAGVTRQWLIAVEKGKATAEVGSVLRTLAALGLRIDVGEDEGRRGQVDLGSLVGDDG